MPVNWMEGLNTPIGLISMAAVKVQVILIVLLMLIAFNKFNKQKNFLPILWPYFLFLIIAAFSILWAPSIPMAVRMFLKFLAPILFYIYVFANIEKIGVKNFINAIMLSGYFYLVLSLVSTVVGINEDRFLGLPGTSRAVFSGHILMVFVVAMAMLVTKIELKSLFLTSIFSVAILGAFTRITIVGMFLSAAVVGFFKLRGPIKILAPVIGVIALIVLFVTVDEFRERMFLDAADEIGFETIFSNPDKVFSSVAGSGRFYAWEVSLDRLYDGNEYLGSGVGATQNMFYGAAGTKTSAVHSELVRLLCDVGIVGVIIYSYFWIHIIFYISKRKYFAKSNIDLYRLYLSSIGMVIGYLIFLLTDNGFDYVGQIAIFVFGTIGAFLGVTKKAKIYPRRQIKL
jgi:hypothetical protein